ncbi:SRPBCC family protein [Limnoglobus roseus]|uniref:Polyketide cyclase n=1 Tax=Limnoglobus roseus TaxID=2598579 RepID=A0A5C1AQP7_9BACT|nr:SRPBCC family protein [Limnoglobus roseus]QEL20373.1 polyketide cyclase [Limnoglobus roseus]
MDIVLYVLIGLAAVVALFLLAAAFRSADFVIARSATVAAPPAAIFPHVNDFHKWAAWSPFEKLDPNMVKTFDGPPAGIGAGYHWSGNAKAGEGRMTITDSRPSDRVQMTLDFVRPFRATNAVEFTFVPEGGQTRVTWSMSGRNGFVPRAFGLIVNIDKLVGRDFEKGLAQLKAIAEAKG